MNQDKPVNRDADYNSIVTLFFILALISLRIFINNYKQQNIVIAWINFFSIFYVLWRIYFQINSFLKQRIKKTALFIKQFKRFHKFCIFMLLFLLVVMGVYTLLLIKIEEFYTIGGCINDIISLFALLFSIEDEKIISVLKKHYRYC